MSQGALLIPTTPPLPGASLVNDANTALAVLASLNSGTSAPTQGVGIGGALNLGEPWLDTSTTPYTLRAYDGAQWVVEGYYDPGSHQFYAPVGGGIATLASAATVDLGSVPQNQIIITGTSAIASFGLSAPKGVVKFVAFTAALTLTYSATSLILPGGANITTAANDTCIAIAQGNGNWAVWNYTPASGFSGGGAWTKLAVSSHTSSYALVGADVGIWQYFTGGSASTFTMPAAPSTGYVALIKNAAASAVLTIAGNGSAIDGVSSIQLQPGMGGIWIYSGSDWRAVDSRTPAFSAYMAAGSFSVTSATFTKVPLDTLVYDTGGNFSASLHRFLPTVPGFYMFGGWTNVNGNPSTAVRNDTAILKNGGTIAFTQIVATSTYNTIPSTVVTTPMNGSTDYVELYAYSDAASPTVQGGVPSGGGCCLWGFRL